MCTRGPWQPLFQRNVLFWFHLWTLDNCIVADTLYHCLFKLVNNCQKVWVFDTYCMIHFSLRRREKWADQDHFNLHSGACCVLPIHLKERYVLCVSCPSAAKFSAILFLLFDRSSSKSPWSFQRFRRTLRRNFNWIRQQIKNFPIDPHCKNCPLLATL